MLKDAELCFGQMMKEIISHLISTGETVYLYLLILLNTEHTEERNCYESDVK